MNNLDELAHPMPGTPLPWQSRDDYTTEGHVTIIGNIDGEYIDGRAECTYDVVCRCEDEFGQRLPHVARNIRYLIHACNNYPATAREVEALRGEVARLRDRETELHGQLMRIIDRWEAQNKTARAALVRPDHEG